MSKSESQWLSDRFRIHYNEHLGSIKAPTVIAGVSGGADSMALLYLLHKHEVNTTIVHCNYGMRGKASDQDQQLVEETASMWGFDVISSRFDAADAEGENFQNWARKKRYEMFRDLKRELSADAILTAHHEDDQLETILQRVMRGSGITAWSGMEVWDGELLRPLLTVSKSDIMEFVTTNHIPYRLDSSNEESTYARNFLRNGWFPVLNNLFPGWRGNLLNLTERAAEFTEMAALTAGGVTGDDGSINRDSFLKLPVNARNAVISYLVTVQFPERSVSKGALENLANLSQLQTGKKMQLDDGLWLIRDRARFVWDLVDESLPQAAVLKREDLKNSARVASLLVGTKEWDGELHSDTLFLDPVSLTWPVTFRRWEQGDRFNPFGMDGTQSVADHLTNEKVSAVQKNQTIIAETFDGRIAAVIFPRKSHTKRAGTIADWAKCTGATKNSVFIQYP